MVGLIEKYRDRLPVDEGAVIVSLQEGNTPLIRLDRLANRFGGKLGLYAKFEGLNPTGSFKDRGMTMAVSKAVSNKAKAIICASTGNTSAAAAAYAARAGIASFVLIPEGKIALGKLSQAVMHGAIVIQIQGNFDDGMRLVNELGNEGGMEIVNSINPYRLHGQKTIAFEIIEELGEAPDFHALPVGNAGNITAHWMGYSEACNLPTKIFNNASLNGFQTDKISTKRPTILGYQASGAAPFLRGKKIDSPETIATAIRIGSPVSWEYAWAAQEESGGWFDECTDAEILRMQKLLAESEGIFCEPASAVSLAGVLRDLEAGKIANDSCIVCTLTGHGLKDPDIAIANNVKPHIVEARKSLISGIIEKHL